MTATSKTNAKSELLALACRSCGYDLAGLRVDGVCPECGKTIWPTRRELQAWARQESNALSDAFWLAIAAVSFWVLIPPLGMVVNIGAVHCAWLAWRTERAFPGPLRSRARVLLVATSMELMLGLVWSLALLSFIVAI